MVDGQCLHTSPNPAFNIFQHSAFSGTCPASSPEKLVCKDHLHRVIIAHEDIGIDIPVPIVTPGRMLEFPPTHTLLPNVTGEVKRFPELKRNKIARKTIFYRQTFSL
jgi:hypothetical protein